MAENQGYECAVGGGDGGCAIHGAEASMNETAAAFRGAHLDANARHWDEMELS